MAGGQAGGRAPLDFRLPYALRFAASPKSNTSPQIEASCKPCRLPAPRYQAAACMLCCAAARTGRRMPSPLSRLPDSRTPPHSPLWTTTGQSRTCTGAPRPRPAGRQRRAAAAVARRARLARRRRRRRRGRRRSGGGGGRGRGRRLWGQVLGRQRRRPTAARAGARARRRPHGARRRRAVRVGGGVRGGRVVRLCSQRGCVSSSAHLGKGRVMAARRPCTRRVRGGRIMQLCSQRDRARVCS